MKKWFDHLWLACNDFCVTNFTKYSSCNPKQKSGRSVISAPEAAALPLEKIHSSRAADIRQYIEMFPREEYVIHHVREQGHFYLDAIDDCIKNSLRAGVPWEKSVIRLIQDYVPLGTTVVDTGAHIGTHTLTMSRAAGPWGRVLAFEPQPKLFRELFLNMALNNLTNVEFYWAAAGDNTGNIELGSLVEKNEGGTSMTGGTGKLVDLITIDSLDLQNVAFIKIDVEGMENAVISGARQTILNNQPVILVEILGGIDFHQAGPEKLEKIRHTIETLHSLNYRVYHLETHNYLAIPDSLNRSRN